jgi:hypothetical protein
MKGKKLLFPFISYWDISMSYDGFKLKESCLVSGSDLRLCAKIIPTHFALFLLRAGGGPGRIP